MARKLALNRLLRPLVNGHGSAVAAILAFYLLIGNVESALAAGDPRDLPYVLGVVNRVLESEKTQVVVPWSNFETGNGGTIIIERTFYPSPETPCRDYRRTANLPGGKVAVVKGTGCRTGTGQWKLKEQENSAIVSSSTGSRDPKGPARASALTTEKTGADKSSSRVNSGGPRKKSDATKSVSSTPASQSAKGYIRKPAPKPPAFPKYTQPSKTTL